MNTRIHYTKPSITEKEIEYATDAARNGWGDKCYDYINRFENAFKDHLGVKYAIATSSATGALHMGMAALGIGEGDEVILANTNWVASVAPILHLNATPVFVDIREDDWCLDVVQVERAITKKTKAILAVHLYGNLCDMDELRRIAGKYNLHLIEDAAEAIGSSFRGEKAGSMGDFGAFSFHGTKTVTTGEGGIFVTNSDELYESVLTLSNHGRAKSQKKQFWADLLGFKYKMSNLQAAIGLAQVERIDELILRKREIFSFYREQLRNIKGVSLNPIYDDRESGYWMPNVVFASELNVTREWIIKCFNEADIDARVFFWPLSTLPFLAKNVDTPVSFDLPTRAINLPSYHEMTEEMQAHVIQVLKKSII
jgi:perosamine synthetase